MNRFIVYLFLQIKFKYLFFNEIQKPFIYFLQLKRNEWKMYFISCQICKYGLSSLDHSVWTSNHLVSMPLRYWLCLNKWSRINWSCVSMCNLCIFFFPLFWQIEWRLHSHSNCTIFTKMNCSTFLHVNRVNICVELAAITYDNIYSIIYSKNNFSNKYWFHSETKIKKTRFLELKKSMHFSH